MASFRGFRISIYRVITAQSSVDSVSLNIGGGCRLKTIDEAIASRIHLSLRYVDLNQSAQKKIWQSFLKKANATNRAAPLAAKGFEGLAKKGLNGRKV